MKKLILTSLLIASVLFISFDNIAKAQEMSPTPGMESPTPEPTPMDIFNDCGNGILDFPEEECDDGNTIDGDGCSSTCTAETMPTPNPTPTPSPTPDTTTTTPTTEDCNCSCPAPDTATFTCTVIRPMDTRTCGEACSDEESINCFGVTSFPMPSP